MREDTIALVGKMAGLALIFLLTLLSLIERD